MTDWYISPIHTGSKLVSPTIEDKVDVFEAQMRGWMLNQARALMVDQHAGFAIMTLATTYFEPLATYVRGIDSEGRSKESFRFGFLYVFEEVADQVQYSGASNPQAVVNEIADECYRELRCGLFHEAITKSKVVLQRVPGGPSIQFQVDKASEKVVRIIVDPWSFLPRVETHLADFVAKLRDPSETTLRANFETQWNYRASRA